MQKHSSVIFPKSKELNINFELNDNDNIGNNIFKSTKDSSKNKDTPKKDTQFKLVNFLKQQQRRNTVPVNNPMDEIIESISKDLKMAQSKEDKEDNDLATFLIEKEKENYINGRKIKLVEIIFHILKKNQKSVNEVLILKLYFLKMGKLVSLLVPLKINISDMLIKLVCQIKCEKRSKNIVLFKYGDIGEKLYILLKGIVGILITKEKTIECTPLEFLKYLILLHLYQEESLLCETINRNKIIINLEERQFLCLMHIFKFYYFLKENKRLTRNYKTVFDFIQGEQKISEYISKKLNFSIMLSLDLLNYQRTTVEQLYEFYARNIKVISKSLKFGLTGSALIANFIKRQIKPSLANKPQTQEELLNYLKPYDEGKKKFKNEEEYYQKISYIHEISHNKILSSNQEKYISRLDPEVLLEAVKQDTTNNYSPLDLINEQPLRFKVFMYYEINQLTDGSIFGELALSDPNNKRTATVITKEDCYFGTLVKQVYDQSLKAAQEKLRLRNVLFFTRGPIFKGISNNIFLSKFFYTFSKKTYRNGDILFKKGEQRKCVFFVVKGELELSRNLSLSEITNIINLLGGVLDDKYLTYLCNTYYQLNNYYFKYKHNFKFCVLKDKEILGLDDLTIDNINIFNCKCVSSGKTELYEIDYNIFKEAGKYSKIRDNIIDFVDYKRKVFIKRLLKQRNALIANKLDKIKISQLKINKINDDNNNNKSNIIKNLFLPITKSVKFSEKKLMFTLRNKESENLFTIKSKISKTLPKTEKITKLNSLSSNIAFEKNFTNSLDIKTFTISGDKNINNIHQLSVDINQINLSNNNNQRSLKIKKNFFNRNTIRTLSDNSYQPNNNAQITDNKQIKNNITYFDKTYKPIIKKIYHSRTRKKIFPFLSYSNSKKSKAVVTPLILKEYKRKFPELRNNINTNNFFIENQQIFDTLLYNEENNDYKFISKTDREKGQNNNKIIYSYNSKRDKKIEVIKNNGINEKIKLISKANQTGISFYKKKYKIYRPEGIIDFLCLDNWEEKERFQKEVFSE